jgi:AAA domain-containing protein
MSMFKKAVKSESKLRMAIFGPPNSGKTFTALEFATGLLSPNGKIAVIDTEHGSADKYADIYNFDTIKLSNFHPNEYIKAIKEADVLGYEVVIIDSMSHAWNGKGGVLEIVGGNFSKWKDVAPIERNFIETILASNLHIIATMRAKMQVEVEKDERGKVTPKVIGMKPVQRDDIEYEFDLVFAMDVQNNLSVGKSRCSDIHGLTENRPTREFMKPIIKWLHGEKKEDSEGDTALKDLKVLISGNANKEPSTQEQQDILKFALLTAFGEENKNKIGGFNVKAVGKQLRTDFTAGEIMTLLQWLGATEANGYTPNEDKAKLAKQIAG